jgi:hypothetical protein
MKSEEEAGRGNSKNDFLIESDLYLFSYRYIIRCT